MNFECEVITVTTAGTAVALASSKELVKKLVIQALKGNTGDMYVGASDVDSTSENGICLDARESFTLTPDMINGNDDYIDISKIYVDASVNGEKVAIMKILP